MQSLIEGLHAAMHHANLSINADHKKISAAFILHCINLRSVNSTPWYLRYSFVRLTIEDKHLGRPHNESISPAHSGPTLAAANTHATKGPSDAAPAVSPLAASAAGAEEP